VSTRAGVIVIAVVFAVLHAYALFQGISNLVALPEVYLQLGIAGLTPWWLLLVGVAAPPLAFAGALVLGRGRILSHRVLLLAVSLATVNAIVLSSGALAPILLAFAAG